MEIIKCIERDSDIYLQHYVTDMRLTDMQYQRKIKGIILSIVIIALLNLL